MSLPYDLIKAESDRIGWPTHYKEDLDIDRSTIDKLMQIEGDDLRFVWGLRELGTHLCQTMDDVCEVRSVYPDTRWYYFDGYMLREMKLLKLVELLP